MNPGSYEIFLKRLELHLAQELFEHFDLKHIKNLTKSITFEDQINGVIGCIRCS